MSTTKCFACSGLVSVAAKSCPHCGHPRPAAPPRIFSAVGRFILLAILAVVIFVILCFAALTYLEFNGFLAPPAPKPFGQ